MDTELQKADCPVLCSESRVRQSCHLSGEAWPCGEGLRWMEADM